jgi:putative transposase
MFSSIPPKLALSNVMQRIKDHSSQRTQIEFSELRKRHLGRRFWARVYFQPPLEM